MLDLECHNLDEVRLYVIFMMYLCVFVNTQQWLAFHNGA